MGYQGVTPASFKNSLSAITTSTNTPLAIVSRDANGNFSAGTVTASLSGNASTVTTNANLTGHITSVGNAAVLGSFTSAQLSTALTDETGSGALVFATSPTLVSPILGTPSSGDLTNCTFPTLNQNTTGSAATLTTGRTIAITGDLAYTSPSFNGSGNVTASGTLATVNSTVGSFGSGSSIPTITVNAKGLVTGVTTTNVSNGTLTLNVSGTGLSGSQTFTANQSSAATFTVTSNATSANTASTIVARDSSGNFTAGTITSTSLSTGSSGVGINIGTSLISGPATITIDPAAVGDNTGTVEIKGNLTVQGTTTTVNSTTTTVNQISLGDNDKALFGDGNDLQIYHDGSNSYIDDAGTGNLIIGAANFQLMNVAHSENHITATDNAQIELFYDGSKKLETTTTGAVVTGILTATSSITGSNYKIDTISSSITDTAVDAFVYDTSKDSDGGAWRKRTQNTSWYNETLNTATRGSRKDFPAVAVIVIEQQKIRIYDGDDPEMPMWMVFDINQYSNGGNLANTPVGIGHVSSVPYNSVSLSCVHMLNGFLFIGGDRVENASSAHAGYDINFISEVMHEYLHYPSNASRTSKWRLSGDVALRNSTASVNHPSSRYLTSGTDGGFAHMVNDVAMTVLPNAPIDPSTGLPIPTIVVATDGGVSVIKDDGNVYDDTDTTALGRVDFNDEYRIISTRKATGSQAARFFISKKIDTVSSDSAWIYEYYTGNFSSGYPRLKLEDTGAGITLGLKGNTSVRGSNIGFTLWDVNSSQIGPNIHSTNSLMCGISTSYNTGWMHGDIKGAFLSDTDATDVTGTELVTNGDFSTNDLSAWTTISGGTATVTGGLLKLTDTSNAFVYASAPFTTVIGQKYVVTFDIVNNGDNTAGYNYVRIGNSHNSTALHDTNYGTAYGKYQVTITATATTTYITLINGLANGLFGYWDNVSVRLAEEDRSVNNKGLQVFGTITKSAVATGADLVAYSGFTNSNYLIQPYNSDMQTGTEDFSVTCWFKTTSSENVYEGLIYYNSPGAINKGFQLMLGPTNTNKGLYWYIYGASTAVSTGYVTGLNNGQWHCAVATHTSSQIQLYIDGILRNTVSHTTGSINNVDAQFIVGRWYGNANLSHYWWKGSIALVRHSKSIPSAEQVKKMYEDEKFLFQENAACTLYGSSDAVTALAFDDTTNLLHVGTSAGRSEFQGLRRINNTTDAVTTAISASNGLVAEQ